MDGCSTSACPFHTHLITDQDKSAMWPSGTARPCLQPGDVLFISGKVR